MGHKSLHPLVSKLTTYAMSNKFPKKQYNLKCNTEKQMVRNPTPSKLTQEVLLHVVLLMSHGLKTQFKDFAPSA